MQRVRESNPISTFRDVTQFCHKYAVGCALKGEMQIAQFAGIAQNYAVRVSTLSDNLFLPSTASRAREWNRLIRPVWIIHSRNALAIKI
jgi:hypothetical protein